MCCPNAQLVFSRFKLWPVGVGEFAVLIYVYIVESASMDEKHKWVHWYVICVNGVFI